MDCLFSIVFICAGGYEYFSEILPNNLQTLCENTAETYDVKLFLDGVENYDVNPYIELARQYGIDEVILRSRKNHCATGDPSNNAHVHVFSTQTRYLLTFESDVAIFKTDRTADILYQIRTYFEENDNLYLATRVDDYDEWMEKLVFYPTDLAKGIRSVNRVSSHFLVYDTFRCSDFYKMKKPYSRYDFYDSDSKWYNYEDMISQTFAAPVGPGIGFLNNLPIRVYHCDKKIAPTSNIYTKDPLIKKKIYKFRKKSVIGI